MVVFCQGMVVSTEKNRLGGGLISHTSAHESSATVAPFQAWLSLQSIIARGPKRPP